MSKEKQTEEKELEEEQMEEKQTGLEERFIRLETIIEKMDKEDVTLDQSFDLYKKGMAEVKAANELLDTIEKAMLVMNEDGELEEF